MVRNEAFLCVACLVMWLLPSTPLPSGVTAPITLDQVQFLGAQVSGGGSFQAPLDKGIRHYVWDVVSGQVVPALTEIREWSLRHPNHLPLFLSLRPADTGQLPKLREEILSVYQRREIVCPSDIQLAAPSLREAIQKDGWPKLERLRGRVVFTLHDTGAMRDAYLKLPDDDLFFVSAKNDTDANASWFLVDEASTDLERIRHLVNAGYLVQASGNGAFDSGAQFVLTPSAVNSPATRSNPVTGAENQGGDDLEGPLDQWVICEGLYDGHLQGIATDGEALYWSHTTHLVKTDFNGKRLRQILVPDHHGDLTWHDDRIYVAVEFGEFNEAPGQTDSWV